MIGDSLPLLSMNADRAARRILDAAGQGRPEVILTPLAQIAARVHGLAPASTVRLVSLRAGCCPQ